MVFDETPAEDYLHLPYIGKMINVTLHAGRPLSQAGQSSVHPSINHPQSFPSCQFNPLRTNRASSSRVTTMQVHVWIHRGGWIMEKPHTHTVQFSPQCFTFYQSIRCPSICLPQSLPFLLSPPLANTNTHTNKNRGSPIYLYGNYT